MLKRVRFTTVQNRIWWNPLCDDFFPHCAFFKKKTGGVFLPRNWKGIGNTTNLMVYVFLSCQAIIVLCIVGKHNVMYMYVLEHCLNRIFHLVCLCFLFGVFFFFPLWRGRWCVFYLPSHVSLSKIFENWLPLPPPPSPCRFFFHTLVLAEAYRWVKSMRVGRNFDKMNNKERSCPMCTGWKERIWTWDKYLNTEITI